MRKLKIRIANHLLKRLFNVVTANSILRITRSEIYIGNKQASTAMKKALIAEAFNIQKMDLWKILKDQGKIKANQVMYEKSNTTDDMMFGKAMLYTIDVFDQIVKKVSQIK